MYIKHNILLVTLLVGSYETYALGLNGNGEGDPSPTTPHQANSKNPIAKDDHISLTINTFTSAEGELNGNDRFGTTYSFNSSWVGQYGQITEFDTEGKYTYTIFPSTTNADLPASGKGVDRFDYTYSNATGRSDTASLFIDINADRSQQPVAKDDHISLVVDTYVSAEGDLSGNDRFGTTFTFNSSWVGQYGAIIKSDSTGEFTYKLFRNTTSDSLPSGGVGVDRFQYTYTNERGDSDTAWLIIDIHRGQDRTPVAKDDNNSAVVGVSPTAIGNVGINDLFGNTFTLSASKAGRYGVLTEFASTGDYIYELYETTNSTNLPSGGQGTDRFEYTYTNTNGLSDTATLIIDVTANPSQPIAEDDYDSTVIAVSTTATGNVGTNDRYGETFTLNDSKAGQYGSLSSFDSTGEYTYDLFESTDNSRLPTTGVANEHFEYTYANKNGLTDTAFLIIDVAPNPNQPIANDDYISTVAGVFTSAEGNVGTNDRYGSIFSLDVSWIGEYGLITSFDSEGKYTYELYEGTDNNSLPFRGVGEDRFQYTYANEKGDTDTAFLIIDVSSNTTLPIAVDDFNFTVIGAEAISGNVTLNDRYGTVAVLSNSAAGQYGTLTSFSETGEYTYTPFANPDSSFSSGTRTDQFLYTYSNAQGFTSGATLFINVSANPIQPKEPIANDDHISTVVGVYTVATGNTSSNDFFGTTYSLDVSWLGTYGAITAFNSAGEFTYELYENTTIENLPAGGVGIDSFLYTYSDDEGRTDTARIIIDVRSNPARPIANDDYISTDINTFTSVTGEVGINDLYGTTFTLQESWSGQYGTITSFDSAGKYSYQLYPSTTNASLPVDTDGNPITDIDKFQYTYANAKGITDTAFIIIDVNPDPAQSILPIANADFASVIISANPTVSGNVIDNDQNGNTVTFGGEGSSTAGTYGFLTSDSSGAYLYQLFDSTVNTDLPDDGGDPPTPLRDKEIFPYTLINEGGETDTEGKLTIDVNPDPAFSGGSESPFARDDNTTYISNKTESLSGNVTDNDNNGDYVVLTSPPSTIYGRIVLQADGHYVYDLYETALSIISLKAGEVVTDEFTYEYFSNAGESTTAKLIIQIIGNPIDGNGDTIFENPDDKPYDNVDVEFNDRSNDATPLNSSRNIQGHLHDTGDKDWYFLSSEGNEIITLEVCPKGTSCFNKKSWVLYVFDSDELAKVDYPDVDDDGKPIIKNRTEEQEFEFYRWVTETGTDQDLLSNSIITGKPEKDTTDEIFGDKRENGGVIRGRSNHMYLAYRAGFFQDALIGIVDPCFDTLNSVDIGVGDGARNYLIAISSPLLGTGNADDEAGNTTNVCGQGSVVLQQQGPSASGLGADGKPKSYETTQEYISVFPNSDDQYAIKITSTGLEPLQSDAAAANSATFNASSGELRIPKVFVNGQSFEATLNLQNQQARSTDGTLKFVLSDLGTENLEGILDSYRATFNAETGEVLFPRITDTSTGNAYSVIMLFHAATDSNPAWLEVTSITAI